MQSFELITKADLEALFTEIRELKQLLLLKSNTPYQKWVKSNKVEELMDISESTLRSWREKRLIPHSKIENTYYYPLAAIEKLLKENKVC